jgi:hypothetical protein
VNAEAVPIRRRPVNRNLVLLRVMLWSLGLSVALLASAAVTEQVGAAQGWRHP